LIKKKHGTGYWKVGTAKEKEGLGLGKYEIFFEYKNENKM
jgi:hypothetical protein